MPGTSVFTRDAAGAIFHTYSAYARGDELMCGTYMYLDIVPKGRDEDGFDFAMDWLRHHDRHEDGRAVGTRRSARRRRTR